MDKCKECFDDFEGNDLIYPKRGYPYCKKCFHGRLSHNDKMNFRPKNKKDVAFIKKEISGSKLNINKVMGVFQAESDRIMKRV